MTETPKREKRFMQRGLQFLALALLLILLYFAFRNAPLTEIWLTLQKLQLWQILLIIAIDILIYFCTSARWWFIVHAENKSVKYLPLISVRISVFGVSYFTIGPQVGGEPLQVLYLQRNHGLTFTRATSTVVMDKQLEFLANFVLLAFSFTALLEAGILSRSGGPPFVSLIGLVIVLTWPFIHIGLMMRGRHPLSEVLHGLPFIPKQNKLVRFIRAAEWMAGTFCRRHMRELILAMAVSLLAAIGMVSEYFLMTSFLGIHLPFWSTVSAWAIGWLSFLVPLPGGLGALEASQVFALGLFGIAPSSAISLVLLMRGRDILIGGAGLLMAGNAARKI